MERASFHEKPAQRYTALILAGRRSDDDPLAVAAGAPHRALLNVHGRPMLDRVVAALEQTACVEQVLLSIDAPALLQQFPALAQRVDTGQVTVVASAASPSRSVVAALDQVPPGRPVLVTTADHALLTPAMVNYFLAEAEQSQADLAVALVEAERVQARFPDARRTYLPFRGERFSGANLFAFQNAPALRAATFWIRAEAFRKKPWRLAHAFGLRALVLFLLRRLDLEQAMAHASRVVGARIYAVRMPFAEAAVDVDRMSDLHLVNEIVSKRCSS